MFKGPVTTAEVLYFWNKWEDDHIPNFATRVRKPMIIWSVEASDTCIEGFRDFPQSLQASADVVLKIRLRMLLPTSLPIHNSLTILHLTIYIYIYIV